MTLKHSQQSPVTCNEKQMLVEAHWNELLFSWWFDSLTQNPISGTRKPFMGWMWFTITNISVFGFPTEPLTFWENSTFEGKDLLSWDAWRSSNSSRAKESFQTLRSKGLVLLKIQAFNLRDQEAFYFLSDENPFTNAAAWNHGDDLRASH